MADEAPQNPKIVLDGVEVEAKPGELVIAAAQRAGTYIPRFCWHPRLDAVGMCRMCLVEIKGPRGFALQPACYVPVADGMEVVTTSDKVKKAQDGVLEFLLINHPLDCPVCDKGGNCPLQDHTLAFGPGETRFVEEKRHWEKPIWLSDLVHIDRERCIQCARCTRFAEEVAGDPLIEFISRGDRTEVNTFPDQPFSSYFSGNTVEICPVGALLATPFRFRARPWDLEEVETTCTACAVGCRMRAQSTTNMLVRFEGVDSDPVNHGWLCDRGRFGFEAWNSPERVTAPLVRKGGELVEASWGEALDAVAEGLGRVSGQAANGVGVIGGARLPNEDAYVWSKMARTVLGTDNVDCQLGDGLPADLVLGLPRATIDQAAGASAVILLAPDIKEELPVLYLRLRAAATGSKVPMIELAPHTTGMSRYVATTLGYRPNQVGALARALVADADPADDAAGVTADAIRSARQVLAGDGDVVVVLGRPSLSESADSVAEAAAALAEGLGERVRFLPALHRGNVHGALDMGLAPGILPGRTRLEDAGPWFRAAWGSLPEEAGLDTTGMLRAAAGGQLGALVLVGADPTTDFPDRQLAVRALEGAGFVVAIDTFLSDAARHADVVLPAAGFTERPGTTTNQEGRITRLGQKVVAPGVAWPDWMIAVELAFRLGTDLGFESLGDIWAEVERLSPIHQGISHELLGRPEFRDGVVAPVEVELRGPEPEPSTEAPGEVSPSLDRADDQKDELLDDGQVGGYPESTPDTMEAAVDQDFMPPDALTYRPPAVAPTTPPPDAYALRLVTSRVLYDDSALVRQSPHLASLARGLRVRVNPYDLDRLGVPSGGDVRLRAARGSMTLEAVADPGVPRGSVSLPFNVRGADAIGTNDLIDADSPVTEIRLESVGGTGDAPGSRSMLSGS